MGRWQPSALAWLSWRYHRGRMAALIAAVTSVAVAAGLLSAANDAGALTGAAARVAGSATVAAALLAYAAWLRTVAKERSRDSALLHDLGVARSALRGAAALEAAFVGVAAGLVGSWLGSRLGAWLLPRSEPAPWSVNADGAAEVGTWLVAAGLLAAALTWSFERLLSSATAALKRSEHLPFSLRAAAGQLSRDRQRACAAATALGLTLAAVIGLQGAAAPLERSLARSLDQAITWDVLVATSSEAGLDLGTLANLQALPSVAAASPERRATVGSRGRAVPLVALDPGSSGRLLVVEGRGYEPGAATLTSGDVVALSLPLARELAVGVGDRLPLSTPTGERKFEVVAIVEDSDGAAAAYLDVMAYAVAFEDRGLDSIKVRLTAGSDVRTAAGELATHADRGRVVTAADYRSNTLTAAGSRYRAARYLAICALLASFFGLIVTAARAARARRDERNLFSALGAPGWLVRRGVALEVGLAVGVAVVVGAGLGALLVSYLVHGLPLTWSATRVSGTTAVALGGATAVGAAALLRAAVARRSRLRRA